MSVTPEITELKGGLRVVTTPVPTAQSVSVNVFAGAGARGETARTMGVAHFLDHWMFTGTTARPTAIAIAEAIEGAGGVLNAYTAKELTCYWNHVPYDQLELAMTVLADMFYDSLLDPKEIDRERTVVKQEISRGKDQPGSYVGELLGRAFYGDHQMGWPTTGTDETVDGLQRDDFVDWLQARYTAPNTVLSVAGNTNHAQVVALAERLFAGSPTAAAPDNVGVNGDELPADRVAIDERPIAQSNIALGLPAIARKDPDRYTLTILNAVLGRGMSSRLFKEVRERRGLAYSIGSGVTRYNDTGVMSISAGVSAEQVPETTQVIKAELMKLVDEPTGEEELTKARDYTTGTFRLSLETPMALAQRTGELLLMLGEIETIDDIVERLQAVTAEDVQRVAKRLFRDDNFSMSLVGPGADESVLGKALAA